MKLCTKFERNRAIRGGVIAISVFDLMTFNIAVRVALGSGINFTKFDLWQVIRASIIAFFMLVRYVTLRPWPLTRWPSKFVVNQASRDKSRSPTLVGKALSFTHKLSLFLYYQSTVLSNRAVDAHQMYFGGSVVGRASTIGVDISPTPLLIFTGVKKCEIWRRFQHYLTLRSLRLKMQQDIWILKLKCNATMIAPPLAKLSEVGSTHPAPLRKLCQFCHTP